MSDEYVPHNPPTVEDWRHLEGRANRNKQRSRGGLVLGMLALVIAVAIGAAGYGIYDAQRDVPRVLARQSSVLRQLKRAEVQRAAGAKGQALALAVIVENLAAFAATPPAPDPNRLRAVEGLCATARQFRAAAGDLSPPVCPAA